MYWSCSPFTQNRDFLQNFYKCNILAKSDISFKQNSHNMELTEQRHQCVLVTHTEFSTHVFRP
jgi:hypothetical protein